VRRSLPPDRLPRPAEDAHGLTAAQAAERLRRFGANQILEPLRTRWLEIVRATARDPMLWFLAGSGALYLLVGDRTEAAVLWFAVVPIVGMDAVLHWRTEASLEGLRSRLAARATVIRDGTTSEIDAIDVVPGDLARIAAGGDLPADGVFVNGTELQVDESTLSGESNPVRKRPWARGDDSGGDVEVDGVHWGFAGTRLLTGSALMRIVYTGGETLYGGIVRTAVQGAGGPTPLQRAIGRLVAVLTIAAAILCIALALIRVWQGHGWIDSLVSAATLAVAALPEEFPIVFTFFLGVGVYRLARRKALVRRATSVENIGRATTILSDKTGTITRGELTLIEVLPAGGTTAVGLLELAATTSRRGTGDPVDEAIYRALEARGIAAPNVDPIASFPFTEARRRETAVVRDQRGRTLVIAKGAPESILSMCDLSPTEFEEWSARIGELAAQARKVLACAAGEIDRVGWSGTEPERDLSLAGLLVFADPVRGGVREAVAVCRDAGVHPVVVTGDHPAVARAVAADIGLGNGEPVVLSGDEVERRISDGVDVGRFDAVARATPAQKLTLVRALQRAGELVVVTGDGVNDVPALQAADVGVAMGQRGTRSAREVASIVLLDDDFGTLVHAIAEGRQLFGNLRLSFQYLLLIHIPLVTTAAVIPLLGYPLCYLPVHVVWMELVIHPTAMLVFQDLPPPGKLRAKRRSARPGFFSNLEWIILAGTAGVASVLLTLGYVRSLGASGHVEHARAMGLTFLVAWGAGCTAVLSGLRTRIARWMTTVPLVISVLAIESPLAHLLHLAPLHLDDLLLAAAGGIIAAGMVAFGLVHFTHE
jgi:Ca2+-transporting ATPase